MTEGAEKMYTLQEAEHIVLRKLCIKEGEHILEQDVLSADVQNVAINVYCSRCGAQFEER